VLKSSLFNFEPKRSKLISLSAGISQKVGYLEAYIVIINKREKERESVDLHHANRSSNGVSNGDTNEIHILSQSTQLDFHTTWTNNNNIFNFRYPPSITIFQKTSTLSIECENPNAYS